MEGGEPESLAMTSFQKTAVVFVPVLMGAHLVKPCNHPDPGLNNHREHSSLELDSSLMLCLQMVVTIHCQPLFQGRNSKMSPYPSIFFNINLYL